MLFVGLPVVMAVEGEPTPSAGPSYSARISITSTSGYPVGPNDDVTTMVTYSYLGPQCPDGVGTTWDGFSWGYGIRFTERIEGVGCTASKKIVIGKGGSDPGKHKVCAGDHSRIDIPVIWKCATFTVLARAATPRPTVVPLETAKPTQTPEPTASPTSGPSPATTFESAASPGGTSTASGAPSPPVERTAQGEATGVAAIERDTVNVVVVLLSLLAIGAVVGGMTLRRRRSQGTDSSPAKGSGASGW